MIPIKSKEEIAIMREGGKILSRVLSILGESVKEGVSAGFLDRLAFQSIKDLGGEPAFLGYKGYKHSTCISKNEEVVHGIPYDEKIFETGDICSLDVGVKLGGFYTDAARTFPVGPISDLHQKLIRVTEEAFFECIKYALPGNRLGDISFHLQKKVENEGFSVVRDLCSHGVGRDLHEEPLIPNYGKRGKGIILESGMTLAIEPMVNVGSYEVLTLPDKWTIITADRTWSAHYENTIFITEHGPEILTT